MYTIKDIDDYQNRLTEEQAEELIKHCDEFDIYPEICAWYDNMDDFYTDWIYDNKIFKTKKGADERYKYGTEIGECISMPNYDFVDDMKKFCNKNVTITEVLSDCYRIKEDNGTYGWTDLMFK